MAIAKTVYQAEDGTLHDTEELAVAHDAVKKNEAKLEAFLDKHFPHGEKDGKTKYNQQRPAARKALLAWIAENN